MPKKDNTSIIWVLLIIGLIVIIIYGGKHGWFQFNMNTYFSENQYSSSLNPNTFENNFMDYSVMLQISPNNICLGQPTTGTITSNINGGACTIFVNSGSGWQVFKTIQLNSQGDYSESQTVNAVGTADFSAICCDSSRNCKISNQASLTVNNCNNAQCIDTDNGIMPNIGGKVTTSLGAFYDTCQLGDDLLEFYCENGIQKSQTIHCSYDCIDSATGDYCITSAPSDTCTDSDGGQMPNIFGVCESSITNTGIQDDCQDFNTVIERFCNSDLTCGTNYIDCPTGWVCAGGQCNPPVCGGIPYPTSPGSCSAGVCSSGTCTFIPANSFSPARCECA